MVRGHRWSPWHVGVSSAKSRKVHGHPNEWKGPATEPTSQAVRLGCFGVTVLAIGQSPASGSQTPRNWGRDMGVETGNNSKAGLHSFIQLTCVRLPLGQEDRSDRSERTLGFSTHT